METRNTTIRSSKFNVSILLLGLLFFSACSTRRHADGSSINAAKAATVMANLKSKKLYNFITEWSGVRYRFGGLDKKGIDCSGFALLLQRDIYGIDLPRVSRDQAETISKKNLGQLKEGDLLFFSFGGAAVDHVGVYLNNDFFVHASTSRGVIVDDLNLPAYRNALVKAGSFKGGR